MSAEYDDADFLSAAAGLDRPAGRQQDGSNSNRPKVVQPKPQALPQRQGPSAILVSTRQKGNTVLNHIKSLPWEYSDIPCDYVLGATTCALFLSLKYHRLHPEYVYGRIRQLGKLYNLRILLTVVDIDNHEQALQELAKTSMINNLTLILAWSAQEAGRYIELFKSYEHASSASIRARQAESWQDSMYEFVTTPRNVNKTDAASLVGNFGSLRRAINAEPDELAIIPGWGEKKVKSWYTSVREPFRVRRTLKTTAGLMRQESSMQIDSDGRDESASSSRTHIPISSVPRSLNQDKGVDEAGDGRNSMPIHKRQRLEEMLPDEFDDDDEAALFAAEQHTMPISAEKTTNNRKTAPDIDKKGPQVSAGIAAALAKYRSDG